MVTIIGKDPKAVKQVTCFNCSSILQYTSADTFIHKYTACGSPESDRCIVCPACGNYVTT